MVCYTKTFHSRDSIPRRRRGCNSQTIMLSRPPDELNRPRDYLYPLFFLFVDPRLFIQDLRSLPVSQSVSSSDLVDHNGIAPAYIGTQISILQRDPYMLKSDALRVCVQLFGVDKHPVHIEDNGLC